MSITYNVLNADDKDATAALHSGIFFTAAAQEE